MDQMDLFPVNDLTAILNAGEGGAPSPLPGADPFTEKVLRDGITDFEGDDDLPGIHISGGTGRTKVIADPSRDQQLQRARLRSRLGPPPQPEPVDPRAAYPAAREYMPPAYPMYAPPAPMNMGAQVIVQAIDLNRGMLLTSHGSIPMSPETVSKIMQLSVATMREFFAESVNATMQAYGLGGKRSVKRKRKRSTKKV